MLGAGRARARHYPAVRRQRRRWSKLAVTRRLSPAPPADRTRPAPGAQVASIEVQLIGLESEVGIHTKRDAVSCDTPRLNQSKDIAKFAFQIQAFDTCRVTAQVQKFI